MCIVSCVTLFVKPLFPIPLLSHTWSCKELLSVWLILGLPLLIEATLKIHDFEETVTKTEQNWSSELRVAQNS